MYSRTLCLISSRKESKPMTLVKPLPSTSCSSIRKFSNAVASSCPPRMNMSLGVILLSCFSLLMAVLNKPKYNTPWIRKQFKFNVQAKTTKSISRELTVVGWWIRQCRVSCRRIKHNKGCECIKEKYWTFTCYQCSTTQRVSRICLHIWSGIWWQ